MCFVVRLQGPTLACLLKRSDLGILPSSWPFLTFENRQVGLTYSFDSYWPMDTRETALLFVSIPNYFVELKRF